MVERPPGTYQTVLRLSQLMQEKEQAEEQLEQKLERFLELQEKLDQI